MSSDTITRVVANDEGITLRRGENERFVAREEGADPSLVETLGAFTENNPASTGGVIVASNRDEGLFSEYFLLQYDQFAGNQSVELSDGSPLPSGFRLFHVNAHLNAEGTDFAWSNSAGSVHNQLIEMIDPDGDLPHRQGASGVFETDGPYRCMLFPGDSITPTSNPSSNFGESSLFGFTGLSFIVPAAGDAAGNSRVNAGGSSGVTSGTIEISHTTQGRPDPSPFTLTLAPDAAVYNVGTLTLEASLAPRLNLLAPETEPYLRIDDAQILCSVSVVDKTVSMRYMTDDQQLKPDSNCSLVFPAGAFVLGYSQQGDAILSPETSIEVPAASVVVQSQVGWYQQDIFTRAHRNDVGKPFAFPNGRSAFFVKNAEELYLCVADKTDVSELEIIPVTAPVDTDVRALPDILSYVDAFAISNDSAVLCMPTGRPGGLEFWRVDRSGATRIEQVPSGVYPSAYAGGNGVAVAYARDEMNEEKLVVFDFLTTLPCLMLTHFHLFPLMTRRLLLRNPTRRLPISLLPSMPSLRWQPVLRSRRAPRVQRAPPWPMQE